MRQVQLVQERSASESANFVVVVVDAARLVWSQERSGDAQLGVCDVKKGRK